jgi:hypothetical protein
MSHSILDIPIATLEKVIAIRQQIETLKSSVDHILGGSAPVVTPVAKRRGRPPKVASVASPAAAPVVEVKKKRTFSVASKAKMAAAQKARWAKKNGAAPAAVETPTVKTRKKRTISPEGLARIAAAQKARWAKVKA